MLPEWKSAFAAAVLACTLTVSCGATPLDDLIAPKPAASACFARTYDAAHLRGNPKQTTKSIAVWLSYDKMMGEPPRLMPPDLGISIERKGDSVPLFAQGGCTWDEAVNRDISDRRLIKEFNNDAGIGCMMLARPDVFDVSSAEEGGYLILDRGKDSDTMMVYLETYLIMVKMADRKNQLDIRFAAADRVFLLHRADPKDCAAIERALRP